MKLSSHKQLAEFCQKRFAQKPTDPPRKGSLNTSLKLAFARRLSDNRKAPGSEKTKQPKDQEMAASRESEEESCKLKRNASFASPPTNPSPRSLSPLHYHRQRQSDVFLTLNKTLTEKLRSLGSHYDFKSRFLVFQEVFAHLIEKEPSCALLLQRIKSGYDEIANQFLACDYEGEICKMGTQLQALQDLLEAQQREREELLSSLHSLKLENLSLSSRLSEKTAQAASFEKQVKSTEPSGLSELVQNLQEEVQLLKKREGLLLSALHAARPVLKHRKTQSTCPVIEKPVASKLKNTAYKEWDNGSWMEAISGGDGRGLNVSQLIS